MQIQRIPIVKFVSVRANALAGTESRHVEPSVCAVYQRRSNGAECDAPLSKEIRHDAAVQTHLMMCRIYFVKTL